MKIDNNNIQQSLSQLSSAKRINSAANDPSGLAISQKMNSQINGYEKATDNALTSKDLSNTAEGALTSIQDSLQRIRELAVQASNGTYTADDRKAMQTEISQLKTEIQGTARNTEFNTIKLLDGSFTDQNMASGPSGTGTPMTIKNTSLETLGIDQFDVTQNFSISDIDNALAQVSDSRASIGAMTNRIDHQVSTNNITSANISSAEDKISNTDFAKTISELKKQQLLQNVQIYVQNNKTTQSMGVLDIMR